MGLIRWLSRNLLKVTWKIVSTVLIYLGILIIGCSPFFYYFSKDTLNYPALFHALGEGDLPAAKHEIQKFIDAHPGLMQGAQTVSQSVSNGEGLKGIVNQIESTTQRSKESQKALDDVDKQLDQQSGN